MEPPKIHGGKAISNKRVLCVFIKGGYCFRRFNGNMDLIPDCWPSYREIYINTQLPIIIKSSLMKKKLFGSS